MLPLRPRRDRPAPEPRSATSITRYSNTAKAFLLECPVGPESAAADYLRRVNADYLELAWMLRFGECAGWYGQVVSNIRWYGELGFLPGDRDLLVLPWRDPRGQITSLQVVPYGSDTRRPQTSLSRPVGSSYYLRDYWPTHPLGSNVAAHSTAPIVVTDSVSAALTHQAAVLRKTVEHECVVVVPWINPYASGVVCSNLASACVGRHVRLDSACRAEVAALVANALRQRGNEITCIAISPHKEIPGLGHDAVSSERGPVEDCPRGAPEKALPRFPVLPTRYLPGGSDCLHSTLPDALQASYSTDAHMQACTSWPDNAVRLTSEHVGHRKICVHAVFVDVDYPGHGTPTAAWRSEEAAKVERLRSSIGNVYAYNTRGGYRLAWQRNPFEISNKAHAATWADDYLKLVSWLARRYGILADPSCKDFSRLYRLPRATRDGVPQDPCLTGELITYTPVEISAAAITASK